MDNSKLVLVNAVKKKKKKRKEKVKKPNHQVLVRTNSEFSWQCLVFSGRRFNRGL
jgi:hypothetical protein